MKYLSLFSGIGGFELGIQQAYEELCIKNEGQKEKRIRNKERPCGKCDNKYSDGLTCIGYSEVDKYAIQIYEKHYNHTNYHDITKINPKELPDFELIVGGFPCQAFSIAGKRMGFDDTRGTLFFDIARIIREKQPRLLLLENVKGLLSHDKGSTFYTIITTLDELGYDLQWQVLNSKNFGVPQNRERVFIIGHLRGEPRPKVFPFGEGGGWPDETQGKSQSEGKRIRGDIASTLNTRTGSTARGQDFIARTLAQRDYKGGNNLLALSPERGYNGNYANAKKTRPNKVLPILPEATGQGSLRQQGADEPTSLRENEVLQQSMYEVGVQTSMENGQSEMVSESLQGKTDIHEVGSMRGVQNEKENGDTPQRRERAEQQLTKSSGDMSGLSHKGTSDRGEKESTPEKETQFKGAIRRLTPVEAERLQGFPDNWTEGLSDTQRYKTLGNAVTVNVIREIMKRLL